MDEGIKIVVTFIVVFAIGAVMLTISSDLLNNSKNNFESINSVKNEDKFIEKNSFSSDEITMLGETCYDKYSPLMKDELCYILKSNNDMAYSITASSKILASSANAKTIYINYDSSVNKVTITD